MAARRALITGVGGQDGSLLAEHLLREGYAVLGTVLGAPEDYETLAGIRGDVRFVEVDLADPAAIERFLVATEVDEVYHLASVSFVPASWEEPVRTLDLASTAVVGWLEAIRRRRPHARFFNASSSEIFGDAPAPQSETTPVEPLSPYGAAKALGLFLTRAFRLRYRLHASSGILFNHESPRRPPHFVTRKITRGAAAIKLGLEHELALGDLGARRDWGYAGDYVRAMHLMLAADEPEDYVIATGEAHTVRELVEAAFREVGLDARDYVRFDESLARGRSGPRELLGDPTRIRERLGWEPTVSFGELVRMMVEADLQELSRAAPGTRPRAPGHSRPS